MPRSKKAQVVSLSKVKGGAAARLALKSSLIATVRSCLAPDHGAAAGARGAAAATSAAAAEPFPTAIVFAYDNMRTAAFKALRASMPDARFFLGRNTLVRCCARRARGIARERAPTSRARARPRPRSLMERALAYGGEAGGELAPGCARLAADLVGNVGLLFSRSPLDAALAALTAHAPEDFARAGWVPPAGAHAAPVVLAAGALAGVPHTMSEWLQKCGCDVRLERGTVVLARAHVLATPGVPITPEQGKVRGRVEAGALFRASASLAFVFLRFSPFSLFFAAAEVLWPQARRVPPAACVGVDVGARLRARRRADGRRRGWPGQGAAAPPEEREGAGAWPRQGSKGQGQARARRRR